MTLSRARCTKADSNQRGHLTGKRRHVPNPAATMNGFRFDQRASNNGQRHLTIVVLFVLRKECSCWPSSSTHSFQRGSIGVLFARRDASRSRHEFAMHRARAKRLPAGSRMPPQHKPKILNHIFSRFCAHSRSKDSIRHPHVITRQNMDEPS
jgi:hypothetical protein